MLRTWGLESAWPAAVGFDDFVDLGHQTDGFAEGDDDLVVVGDVGHSRILAVEIQSVRQITRFDCHVSYPPCLSETKVAFAVVVHELISSGKFLLKEYADYFCLL